jgi:hypothetical protein
MGNGLKNCQRVRIQPQGKAALATTGANRTTSIGMSDTIPRIVSMNPCWRSGLSTIAAILMEPSRTAQSKH